MSGPLSLSPLLTSLTRLVLYPFPSLQPLSHWHSRQSPLPKPSGGPAQVTSNLGPHAQAASGGLGPPHAQAFKLIWMLVFTVIFPLSSTAPAPNNQLSSQGPPLSLVLSTHFLPSIRSIIYLILQLQTHLHLSLFSVFPFSFFLPKATLHQNLILL